MQLRNRRSCGFKGEKIISAGIYGSLLGDISDSSHMMLLYGRPTNTLNNPNTASRFAMEAALRSHRWP